MVRPVQDHGCKFPIILYGSRVLFVPDLVCDDSELFEDEAQLTVDARGEAPGASRVPLTSKSSCPVRVWVSIASIVLSQQGILFLKKT